MGTKLSQIAAGTAVRTDQLVGVKSGTTDQLFTIGDLMRTLLTANTTFYVSNSGVDVWNNNQGLSSGSPWLTLQFAYEQIVAKYDLNGFTATIQLADGTYAGLYVASGWTGSGNIVVNGNVTTPDNVIINAPSASLPGGVIATAYIYWNVNFLGAALSFTNFNVVFDNVTQTYFFMATAGTIQIENVDFGVNGDNGWDSIDHLWAQNPNAQFLTLTGYKISGGAAYHIFLNPGQFTGTGSTVTIANNPSVDWFVGASGTTAIANIGTLSGSFQGPQLQLFYAASFVGNFGASQGDYTKNQIQSGSSSNSFEVQLGVGSASLIDGSVQYSHAPGTGATININQSQWELVLDDAAGSPYAALTIATPAKPQDGRILHWFFPNTSITALTVTDGSGNGYPINGAPASITAGQGLWGVFQKGANGGPAWFFHT